MSEVLEYSAIGVRDPADTLIAFGPQQIRFLGSVTVALVAGQTQVTVIGGGAPVGTPNTVAIFDSLGALVSGTDLLWDEATNILRAGSTLVSAAGSNTFMSGDTNTSDATNSIIGGEQNIVDVSVQNTLVIGGANNVTAAVQSLVAGASNQIFAADDSMIAGTTNTIDNMNQSIASGTLLDLGGFQFFSNSLAIGSSIIASSISNSIIAGDNHNIPFAGAQQISSSLISGRFHTPDVGDYFGCGMIGENLKWPRLTNCIVVGQFNLTTGADKIFVVGMGTSDVLRDDGFYVTDAGDVNINRQPRINEGSNKAMGIATLVGGTVTVSNTLVTANSRIMLTGQNSSGAHGELTISARTPGTDFTITSTSATDTRDVAWIIFEPGV